jgi:hypothetical protein
VTAPEQNQVRLGQGKNTDEGVRGLLEELQAEAHERKRQPDVHRRQERLANNMRSTVRSSIRRILPVRAAGATSGVEDR